MKKVDDEIEELNRRETVYPGTLTEDDFEHLKVRCVDCGQKRDFEKPKAAEYDYPKLMRCYECMDDTGHVPVDG